MIWLLILSLAPLLASAAIGYLVSRRIIMGQTTQYLTALTGMSADHVAGEMERHELALTTVAVNGEVVRLTDATVRATDPATRSSAARRLSDYLRRRRLELQPFSDVFVIDTAGDVIAASSESRLEAGWRPRPAEDSLHGAVTLFTEALGPHDGDDEPGVAHVPSRYGVMAPIVGEGPRNAGSIAATIEFDSLRLFLRIPQHLAGDVHAYIVDRQGRPIVISHAHTEIDPSVPLPGPLIHRPAGTVERYTNYEGIEVLGAIEPIPGLPWRYLTEVYVSSAFGQLGRLAAVSGVAVGAFALLLFGAAWFVSGTIVGPVRDLVRAAERIRRGELGAAAGIERMDELGELGRTFDQMSHELLDSHERLQELHDREMQRAGQLASVGELASGIAHEIKNPIVGISSGLDLLERHAEATPQTGEIIVQLRAQLTRMESAIRDLLSYARPREPRLLAVEPIQLIDRVIQLVRPQAETNGIQLIRNVRETRFRIHVDPELMTQALVNLALNAIQAMKAEGILTLEVESSGDTVQLAVEDTGPGIPDELRSSIFRPFVTTKHSGTGLGLTITRAIVERHGGELRVDSGADGQGARFIIALPGMLQSETVE